MNEKFLEVGDVMQILGISRSAAYKLVRQINSELEKKEDLYTAYYAVSEDEEIVADREIEIPGMEEDTEVEKATATVVEPDANVEVMNLDNNQNEISGLKEQVDSARKQQTDLDGIGIPEILNLSGER